MSVDDTSNRPVCLRADNISFSYGGDRVLENISLSIRQEEFVGIAGLNGSGKTTLLKILVGLLKPDTGMVEFTCHKGECEGKFPCRPCIGYVPQQAVSASAAVPGHRTGGCRNGGLRPVRPLSRPTTDDFRIIDKTIAEAGLCRVAGELFSDLSGGQQQRVLIARALAGNPHILALDEPTNGVDARSKEEFYSLLSHLHSTHKLTVLLILHDLTELPGRWNGSSFCTTGSSMMVRLQPLGPDGLWNLMVRAGKE